MTLGDHVIETMGGGGVLENHELSNIFLLKQPDFFCDFSVFFLLDVLEKKKNASFGSIYSPL